MPAAGAKVGQQRVVRQRSRVDRWRAQGQAAQGRGLLQAANQAGAGLHAGHIGRGAQVIGLDARRLRRVGRGNVDAAGAGGRQGLKPKIKPGQGSGRSSGRRGTDFGPRHHGGRPHRNPVARPRPRLARPIQRQSRSDKRQGTLIYSTVPAKVSGFIEWLQGQFGKTWWAAPKSPGRHSAPAH